MAKWKLCRQTYGDDTYELTEGEEVTIGRGTQNTIILSSLNISRKHCVLTVKKDEVVITDLKSANGIFVGLKKITPNTPFLLFENDLIGLGWTDGAPLKPVNDCEKFMFKLLKVSNGSSSSSSLKDRIQYHNEYLEDIEAEMAILSDSTSKFLPKNSMPSKLSLKRKSNTSDENPQESDKIDSNINDKIQSNKVNSINSIENSIKRFKSNFVFEDAEENPVVKIESEDEAQYEAFNIKQECLDDDEIQVIDSDSDSEQWFARLSQNSPRKSFVDFCDNKKSRDSQQDSSYSQLDDDVIFVENEDKKCEESDDEQYVDDLITILPPPTEKPKDIHHVQLNDNQNLKNADLPFDTPTVSNVYTNSIVKDKGQKHATLSNTTLNNIFTPMLPPQNEKLYAVHNDKSAKTCDENINITGNNVTHNFNACNMKEQQKAINAPTLDEVNVKEPDKFYPDEAVIRSMNEFPKKIQIINCTPQPNKKPTYSTKSKPKKKHDRKSSKQLSAKIQITNSQKEERKKKLRAIANKEKVEDGEACNPIQSKNEDSNTTTVATKVNAKVTTSNRGAFLIAPNTVICKPSAETHSRKMPVQAKDKDTTSMELVNDKISNHKKDRKDSISLPHNTNSNGSSSIVNKESCTKYTNKDQDKKYDAKPLPHKTKTQSVQSPLSNGPVSSIKVNYEKKEVSPQSEKTESNDKIKKPSTTNQAEHPQQPEKHSNASLEKHCKNLHNPPSDKILNCSGEKENSEDKTMQNVQKNKPESNSPLRAILKPVNDNKEPEVKGKKKVRFSEKQPDILVFEIEQGNQMKKTSTVKTTLLATRHIMPVFPLEKIALMKVLKWNPQWLEEQNNFSEPPPILGHNNVPMAILHSFASHAQYNELIGNLLMMEIWECLTQGYIKNRNEIYHQLRIESLPLVTPHKPGLELMNLSVNLSIPTSQSKSVPREGEIMIINFGEDFKISRFFFVHNVRCLPSPPNNVNSFYSISLQTSFTEKIRILQRGMVMYGKSLAYINKDLRLFEAMDYLSTSPLVEVILNPQPHHFIMSECENSPMMESQWTKPLNDSQRKAVMNAVTAALEDKPRIQMVQGPPGTGKSRVICAIIMSYFYDTTGKKLKNRGKILICATSNAAVDELVVRLLDIRQSLPHPERLNMVRVGRVEAMHPRARDISSARLAQRDAARALPPPDTAHAAHAAEISLLEAKKNKWQSSAMYATDDARKAYCQGRVAEITKKIAMFRGGGGGACAPQQVAAAERRVLEGADVVLTTLASAHSHKMRGLARKIALCIVDEAGQAIEPETLVPLTLDVTRLLLIGDPQQLPGFICSQRAKEHGLGESLFSRLSSCVEARSAGAAGSAGGALLLDRQYRMHPHIAEYPNRAFYGGLVSSAPPRPLSLPIPLTPYFVLGIISGDRGQDGSGANAAEAWGAARVAAALRARARRASLAVITPYAAQRDLVRAHLRLLTAESGAGAGSAGAGSAGAGSAGAGGEAEAEGGEVEVEVNTVDSFQGQERDVVVVSLARSHGLGFLTDAGRMNVMLTRARHALVLCLNPYAVEKNNQWRSLVEDAQKRNLYNTLPLKMCQHPSVQQVSNQEILQYLTSYPQTDKMINPVHHTSKQRSRMDNDDRYRPRRGRNYRLRKQ